MSRKLEIELEERIVTKVVECILAHGYRISVSDGEEIVLKKSDILYVWSTSPIKCIGWIVFIYGNSGHDVIHDYTTNLEPIIQPALDFANQY